MFASLISDQCKAEKLACSRKYHHHGTYQDLSLLKESSLDQAGVCQYLERIRSRYTATTTTVTPPVDVEVACIELEADAVDPEIATAEDVIDMDEIID